MIRDSVKWYDKDGYDHMLAIEGETPDEFQGLFTSAMNFIKNHGGQASRKPATSGGARTAAASTPAASQPAAAEEIGDLTKPFATDADGQTFQIKMSEAGDKRFAKVYCSGPEGNWMKYGVTAWPEPFKLIGIDIETLNLGVDYRLPDYVARIKVLYDPVGGQQRTGTPKKVLSFVTEGPLPQDTITPAVDVAHDSDGYQTEDDIPF